jgi:hypothetical protein
MSESLPQNRLSERILTEGELTTLEIINNNGHVGYEGISSLIESYRSLLSANHTIEADRDIALQAADNAIKQTVVLSDRVTELEASERRYKTALRKILCLNVPMPDEVFNLANIAYEGVRHP